MNLQQIKDYLKGQRLAVATKKLVTKEGSKEIGLYFHANSNIKDRWIRYLTSLTSGVFKVYYVNEEVNVDI